MNKCDSTMVSKSERIALIIESIRDYIIYRKFLMSKLVEPNKARHQYVVGIDFGHGETSAAICELEWDKDAGQRENNVLDLDMDRKARKKVIPSAICRVKGNIYIGDEAFEHMTDNDGIRVCFKQKPQSLEGESETLMIDYMRAVYNRIREADDRLTDTNHIVYIARPSGWQDEQAKELYRQMAIKAGIPLSGLTSESRAAIFYARSPRVNFSNEIAKGAIVFDLGSSTVDFTYLSDKDKPIDNGYNLGASIIDNVIYEHMILKSDDMKEFIAKYPEYTDSLRFRARKFKEDAYSRNAEIKTTDSFDLDQIILPSEQAYDEYGDVHVKLKIQNLQELNDLIEAKAQYVSKLREALIAYLKENINGKIINGVFLTGGASRMNFIRSMIAETLQLSEEKVKYDKDNPSLTISRGIALLGSADAATSVLVKKLKESIPHLLTDAKLFDPFVNSLSENISKEAWRTVETACNNWIKYGPGTDREELKKKVESSMRSFQSNRLNEIVDNTLQSFINKESETIRQEMNKIISRYAPGQEISMTGSVSIGDQEAITRSLRDMTDVINAISKSTGDIIADILWKALAAFLWGVFAIPYYILKAIFTSDESKRKDKAKDILNKEYEITSNVKNSIRQNLISNRAFKTQVTTALKNYFTAVIDMNLQRVIIPIE